MKLLKVQELPGERVHGRRQREGRAPPWIFKHGTNIVDKVLKVLFSAFFCYFSVFISLPSPPET